MAIDWYSYNLKIYRDFQLNKTNIIALSMAIYSNERDSSRQTNTDSLGNNSLVTVWLSAIRKLIIYITLISYTLPQYFSQ